MTVTEHHDANGISCKEQAVAIPLIELIGIHRTFKTDGGVEVHALRGIDLKIYAGEFLAIIGQSGSGKSTLMNLLGALDSASGGDYVLAGERVNDLNENQLADLRNRTIGFVFQGFNLLPRSSLLDNVALPLTYAGVAKAEREQRAKDMLTRVGLGARWSRNDCHDGIHFPDTDHPVSYPLWTQSVPSILTKKGVSP